MKNWIQGSHKKRALLLVAGLALIIWGVYAIDHIDTLLFGYRWTAQIIAGLGMGVAPLIIGVFIMVFAGVPARFLRRGEVNPCK